MGLMQRNKGRKSESEFKRLLQSRDWRVDDLAGGLKSEDLIATAPCGTRYSVEVKNHVTCSWTAFLKQAREQGAGRNLPWMLAVRIPGYAKTYVVLRANEKPTVWAA